MRRLLLFLIFWLSMSAAAGPGIVIVSGGTRGIGRELVKMLYAKGWKVATFARTPEDVEKLRVEFPDSTRFFAEPLSITDMDGVRRFAGDVARTLGPVNHLVNNAGTTGEINRLGKLSADKIKTIIDINLTGPLNLTSAVVDEMENAHIPGVIVNVSSGSSSGVPGLGPYGAAKAGINSLTVSAGKEYGAKGIRIFSLNPGHVDTELQAAVRGTDPKLFPAAADFVGFHERGELVDARHSAEHIMYLLEHPSAFENGSFVSYRDVARHLTIGEFCNMEHIRYLWKPRPSAVPSKP